MCGIVGIIAKQRGFYSEHDDMFEEMLYLDGPRGMDSTGVFVVTNKNEVHITKQAANPGIFLQTQSWYNTKKKIGYGSHIVIGHNRKATFGATVSKNAHPFAKEHIILVHNGFISNHKELDKDVEVDSEAIISVLLKEEDPLVGLKKLFGAYAIVWYNKKNRKLFMARNKERPLAIAHSDTNMLIASERGMLNWIIERNKMSQFGLPKEIKEDVLYEISFRPYTMTEMGIPIQEWFPTQKELPVTTPSTSPFNSEEFSEQDKIIIEEIYNNKSENEVVSGGKEINEEDVENRVKQLRRLYPFGTTVLYWPKTVQLDGSADVKYTRIRGPMWVPGKPAWDAVVIVASKEDKEEYLDPGVPLVAKIQSMSRKGDDIYFNLENLQKSEFPVESGNGLVMSEEEWTMICNRLVCGTCNKAPLVGQVKGTEVIQPARGRYEITCASCFAEIYKHTSFDKPTINEI